MAKRYQWLAVVNLCVQLNSKKFNKEASVDVNIPTPTGDITEQSGITGTEVPTWAIVDTGIRWSGSLDTALTEQVDWIGVL